MKELDRKYVDDEAQLRKRVRALLREREEKGEGCIGSECQPAVITMLDNMVFQKVDVCTYTDVGLRWFQGKVLYVKKNNKRCVMVDWDATKDIKGWENGGECVQTLMISKWKKHVEGAWRYEYIDDERRDDDDNLMMI